MIACKFPVTLTLSTLMVFFIKVHRLSAVAVDSVFWMLLKILDKVQQAILALFRLHPSFRCLLALAKILWLSGALSTSNSRPIILTVVTSIVPVWRWTMWVDSAARCSTLVSEFSADSGERIWQHALLVMK